MVGRADVSYQHGYRYGYGSPPTAAATSTAGLTGTGTLTAPAAPNLPRPVPLTGTGQLIGTTGLQLARTVLLTGDGRFLAGQLTDPPTLPPSTTVPVVVLCVGPFGSRAHVSRPHGAPYRSTGPRGQTIPIRGPGAVPVVTLTGAYGDSADVTGPIAPTVTVTGPRS
jgi:hypothetical protein